MSLLMNEDFQKILGGYGHSEQCDALNFPCACGATHIVRGGVLVSREILKQAIEALEYAVTQDFKACEESILDGRVDDALAALREVAK